MTKKVAPKWISGFKSTKTVDDKANTKETKSHVYRGQEEVLPHVAVWRAPGS